MGDDPNAVVQFVADYRDTALKSFCHGIEMDMDAVLNAVRSDLSSGFVEGGNNKIKVIKRIGYGRASLRSLEAKCVIAFQSTKIPEFDLCTIVDFPSRRVRRHAA